MKRLTSLIIKKSNQNPKEVTIYTDQVVSLKAKWKIPHISEGGCTWSAHTLTVGACWKTPYLAKLSSASSMTQQSPLSDGFTEVCPHVHWKTHTMFTAALFRIAQNRKQPKAHGWESRYMMTFIHGKCNTLRMRKLLLHISEFHICNVEQKKPSTKAHIAWFH